MTPAAITVRVKRRLLESFKRQAREAYPRETFAFLLGHEEADLVEIVELYELPEWKKFCTRDRVKIQPGWLIEAQEHASDAGLVVVGDIHSHPECCSHEQSEADFDYAPGWNKIAGICRVSVAGERLRSSIRFWGPMIPVKAEVV